MAIVQSVNGFGWATDRSVARPYGYGRGLMTVDPAYGPHLSGRYAPVIVSYQNNGLQAMVRTGNSRDSDEEEPLSDRKRKQFEGVDITTARAKASRGEGATLKPQPEASGKPLSDRQKQQFEGVDITQARAGGGHRPGGSLEGAAAVRRTEAAAGPAAKPGGKQGLEGPWNPFAAGGATQEGALPFNVGASLGGYTTKVRPGVVIEPGKVPKKGSYITTGQPWLMDTSTMERVRQAAVDSYLIKNNKWAAGQSEVLGVRDRMKEMPGATKAEAIAAMIQVIPRKYEGARPAAPAGLSPGHPQYDRLMRGDLVENQVFKPAFTAANVASAYTSLGLWRGTKEMAGEIQNWKRAFNALGMYSDSARPNLGSLSWGAYENDAMARFMTYANSNPQAAQGYGDLPKLRNDLMDLTAAQAAAGGGEQGGGGQTFPFTQTRTDTSVQISNMEDARETLRGHITNLIGRAPTDAEVRQFLGKLNDYERGHPTRTTTTTTYSDENTATATITGDRDDNIDPFNVSQDFAKTQVGGDYHAYQQLKYYQAISDIIGNPAGVQSIPQEG